MTRSRSQLSLSLFIRAYGHHPAAWRHPASASSGRPDLAYWVGLAKRAEQAKFDAVFVADFAGQAADQFEQPGPAPLGYQFEPLTLMMAIAGATERIGLIATLSTNYNEPYNVARSLASIDHLSGGRAGWNIVTSLMESSARAFGKAERLSHEQRYQRAIEFVDLCKAAWNSWDDDAFGPFDKAATAGLTRAKAHPIRYHGDHFRGEGLLDIARPVQGYPVLVQAGNSDRGIDFAARTAEMVYCTAQSFDIAQAYYTEVKGRMAAYDRNPDALLVTPGIMPVIGATQQEADDKYGALQDLYDVRNGARLLGIDLSGCALDEPVPDLPEVENSKGRHAQMVAFARTEQLTVRELIKRFTVVRGHHLAVGTAISIADTIEQWFTGGAADGFNILPPVLPAGLDDFATQVIPELQRRGLFRTSYSGWTLREHLSLDRPSNPNSAH